MKIQEIDKLISKYGNLTFQQLKDKLLKDTPHKCPKCNGWGHTTEQYDAYPSGFPDSGWVQDIRTRNVPCTVCDGNGYTKKLIKPVIETKIVGYE